MICALETYERAIDEAKIVLDDMYTELKEMTDAMAQIRDLACDADEDNWKEIVNIIQTTAENYY